MGELTNEQFPAIAAWVQHGTIEIGLNEVLGFVAMANDCGGTVFRDDCCETFADCLKSLEQGLVPIVEDLTVNDVDSE